MDPTTLITALVSLATGGGIAALVTLRSTRRKADSEAAMAEDDVAAHHWSNLDKRIDDLHDALNVANNLTKSQQSRIGELNRALDDKTDRIRKLTDEALDRENALHDQYRLREQQLHDRIVSLTEQLAAERLRKEHYKQWLCQDGNCPTRRPPNPILRGLEYQPPHDEPAETAAPDQPKPVVAAPSRRSKAKPANPTTTREQDKC